jgi:hypothetical protein
MKGVANTIACQKYSWMPTVSSFEFYVSGRYAICFRIADLVFHKFKKIFHVSKTLFQIQFYVPNLTRFVPK